jgi:trehalose/maltose transport system permease protein
VYSTFPLYFAVLTSLKRGTALLDVDYFPFTFDMGASNYRAVLHEQAFATSILNSVMVATAVVLASLVLGFTAAFALARLRFAGRSALLATFLVVSMFPQVAVLSGMFELVRYLGLYNSLGALVTSYLMLTLPFTVWMLTTFIRQVPVELEEAARVDGIGLGTMLWRVFLPLCWPGVVTTALLTFIAAWNEFLFALTFTLTNDQRTVPVAIALLSGGSQHELPWGNIMAASVMVTLPLVGLLLVFQRRIVSGLTEGAVKG